MRTRVLAQVLAPTTVAVAISMLAACDPAANPVSAGYQSSTTAPSGSAGGSAPRGSHSAQSADAPASPGSGAAAEDTQAQPGPGTAAKRTPAQRHPHHKAQHKVQPPPAPDAGPVLFGAVTSDRDTATTGIDPDRTTFTTLFSDLVVDLEKGVPSAGTHLVIPLTGGAHNATLTVYLSGYVFTLHATARLSFTVNGTTIVKNFPAGADHEFVQPLELPAIGGSAYQLSLTLEGQQAPGSDGTAFINVSAIDGNVS
jgi:hypothetical protein